MADPLSIALLTYSTRPRGGVVHTLALAEALARAGHDVTVWSLGRGGDRGFFRKVDPAVRLRLVPFPDRDAESVGQRIVRSIDALRDGFDGHGVDIVHAQDCISANAVPACIRTVHHLDNFTTPELVACHERAIVTPYAHICVSRSVSRELADGWGLTATVIPNGVDYRRFADAAADEPAARAARKRWQDRFGRYVLAVGGIEPRKGTADLIEAMALLRSPHVSLVIAGGETLFDYRNYREACEARARKLGVVPIVLGPVDDIELPSLVAAAGAFAFPSTKEGFGLAAMEALAAGVPLAARDLPVLREVFAGTARFARTPRAFAMAMDDALAAPDPQLCRRGRALAQRHTWDAAAAAHVSLYRQHAA